jgi:hypothetical protein
MNAIQREVEATKPPGTRMEEYMHSGFSFDTGRSVCTTARRDLCRVPFGHSLETWYVFLRVV